MQYGPNSLIYIKAWSYELFLDCSFPENKTFSYQLNYKLNETC